MDSYSHGDQTNAAKLIIKVGLSPSKKNLFYLLRWKPFKNDEKGLKTHFVLKIFQFLSWLFCHVEKDDFIR